MNNIIVFVFWQRSTVVYVYISRESGLTLLPPSYHRPHRPMCFGWEMGNFFGALVNGHLDY